MGIRGLTTYINKNENSYMDSYVVPQNSVLILDGESVAANIYLQDLQVRNSFFGGDYEIYANAIIKFFNMLFDCKITPYVICSGATESRKVDTLMKRMRARMNKIIRLDGRAEVDEPIYPLFIGEVFRDIVKRLNVKMVVCDFEADLEIANVARELDVPVLSLDSDFYIFDVKYIPFSLGLHLEKMPNLFIRRNRRQNGDQDLILTCKIFNRDNFLFETGLAKEMLPILTIFLGNDFIEREKNIIRLYKHLNIKSPSRDFVKNIINWLKNQNASTAVDSLLNFYGEVDRARLGVKIKETIHGYTCSKSKFLKYLNHHTDMADHLKIINVTDSTEYLSKFPKLFIDNYRRGFYQHNFIEILINHRYYPKLLVENINKEHSYKRSYDIISALHKILTNSSSENFIIFSRIGTDICQEIVPPYTKDLPNFEDIQQMNLEARMNVLFDILQIDKTFAKNCLDLFDESWKSLLMTLKYLSRVSNVSSSFTYALILCKIIITYIDSKLGQIRYTDELYHHFPRPRKYFKENIDTKIFQNVSDSVKEITMEDSFIALETLMPYFWMDDALKYYSRLFDRNFLHVMSEFQATLLHFNFLNSLLNLPYQKGLVQEFYNGTFIYNLAHTLNRKGLNFVLFLLRKSPTVLNCFDFAIKIVKDNISLM